MIRPVYVLLVMALSYYSAVAQETSEDNEFTRFFYGNGQISSEGFMRDGKPDGIWTSYYPNGEIKSLGKRTHFLLDSVWCFYNEQGRLTEEISYLNGKKSGYTIRYQSVFFNDTMVRAVRLKELYLDDLREGQGFYFDDEGKMERIVRYRKGKKHGLTRLFNEDSVIQTLYKYHNDFLIDREFINQTDVQGRKQGLWKELYDNDNIKVEENYRDGRLNGYYREYSERGELLITRYYENGQQIKREEDSGVQIDFKNEYDEKGQLISSGGYRENVPVGTHRRYTDDRSAVLTTEFTDSGEVLSEGVTDEKGDKNEYWKFYYTDGQVRSEGNFNNNLRDGVWKFYYPDGKLEQTGTFRNGQEDGLWVWYYPDGSVRREENYYRGREDGMSIEYDEKGMVLARGEYLEGLEEGEWFYHIGDHTEKGFYKGGERDGIWTQSYTDGTSKFTGSYVQGYPNGRHRYFYEDGKIREERFYEMGRKEKNWRKYDLEGNVTLTLSYSNDILVRINGIKVNLEDVNN